ncbi:MAG: prolipoprotein diacylglyceryl transferase [Planctomycetota bacterium]|jgi:phosphatidylglycerol:prolipoprotein diacylglycerol transferase
MHPELFEIPFLHVTVKSYGTMMVIGFLLAVVLMRRMMKRTGQNPEFVTNVAMYALISGIVGAHFFYVFHHRDQYVGRWLDAFIDWRTGLEFLGGVLCAIAFLVIYLWRKKLPKRLYLDVLAVGLMIGLGFGRVGCLLNGCCYGKCSEAAVAIQFPYASLAFYSQANPDMDRGRTEAMIDLPSDYYDAEGYLKEKEDLTAEQLAAVSADGPYHTLPVLPTQVFSTINAFILAGILYAVWRRFGQRKPGVTLSLMFMLYGPTRFYLETLRDDNPFEQAWWAIYKGGTVSQNIGIYLLIAGAISMVIFATRKPIPEETPKNKKK